MATIFLIDYTSSMAIGNAEGFFFCIIFRAFVMLINAAKISEKYEKVTKIILF